MKKLIQKAWFYFRMGHGVYLTFPLSFVGFIITLRIYLQLVDIPYLSSLRLWEFTLAFTIPYTILAVIIGRFHIRTQSWTDSEVAAPQSPYEYKIKPFGREAKLNTPSSLTFIRVQKATLLLIERIAPDIARELNVKELLRELEHWEGMTENLLAGGEVR